MISEIINHVFKFDSTVVAAIFAGWLLFTLVHQQTNFLLHYFYRTLSPKSHREKVVWIIGASSGIGESLAREYAQVGASLILSARRLDRLTELAEECSQYGERPMVLPLDMTHLSEHPNYVAKVLAVYEKVDILVLNSGKFQFKTAMETSFEQTEDILQLNLMSYISLTKLLLPSMIKHHTGKIVVMNSLLGLISFPYISSYCATKFALRGFFDCLRVELASSNISVHQIYPGPIETEIFHTTVMGGNIDPMVYSMITGQEKRLSAARCAHWIIRGVHYGFEEIWIAKQMILWTTSFGYYCPYLYRQFLKLRFLRTAFANNY